MKNTRYHYEVRNYYGKAGSTAYGLYDPTGTGEHQLDAAKSLRWFKQAKEEGLNVKRCKVTTTVEVEVV